MDKLKDIPFFLPKMNLKKFEKIKKNLEATETEFFA